MICPVCSTTYETRSETCSRVCGGVLSQQLRVEKLRITPPTTTALWHERSKRWVDPELGVVYAHFRTDVCHKIDDAGYVAVAPHYRAHTLIWEVVHGPVPKGMTINHKDFNRSNNVVSNLECVTQRENVLHSRRAGRYPTTLPSLQGERHHKAKLSASQVREIRASGGTQQALADHYGVSKATIGAIRSRRIWTWLD